MTVFNPRHHLIQARKQLLLFPQISLQEENSRTSENVLISSHPGIKPQAKSRRRKGMHEEAFRLTCLHDPTIQ